MSYSHLHETDIVIQIKSGITANINTTATKNSAVTGEPHYTTDGKALYVFDGTVNESVTSRSPLVSVSADTTLDDTYEMVEVTAVKTITLPTAVGRLNKIFEIIASIDGVTVDADGTETIGGDLTQSLFAGDSMRIISNNTNWRII